MALSKDQVLDLYRKRAERYNFTANLYYLLGFREFHYRQIAISFLNLRPGDTVVEIGCGTGLNFPLIQKSIGSSGKLIGVDLTDKMLAKANERVRRYGWNNVNLVRSDAAVYKFPHDMNAALSTFAITLVPEFDQVIKNAADSLAPGGRLAILDFKKPSQWPQWLIRLYVWISAPFGVSLDLADRHPWESVQRYFTPVIFKEMYGGGVYLSVGKSLSKS